MIYNLITIRHCTFCIVLCTFLFSCRKDKPADTPTDFGYNYYPNTIGHYVVYQVDSIWQDDKSNVRDTTRYLLKELIAAAFLDNSGRPTLRIERYSQFYHFDTHTWDTVWSVPRVWTANRTPATLERKEENITYLKLIFPVKLNKQWNGNVYNTLGTKTYTIAAADQPDAVGALHFDSVATVTQFDEENLVLSQIEKEKFARNVGLIYKQRDSVVKQGVNFADTVGYRFSMKIMSYGK